MLFEILPLNDSVELYIVYIVSVFAVCIRLLIPFLLSSTRQMIQIQGPGVKSNTRFMDQGPICE